MGRSLAQLGRDVQDALDDMLCHPAASQEDRCMALRLAEAEARRRADCVAKRILDEWLAISEAADRILHGGASPDKETDILKLQVAEIRGRQC